MTVVDQKSIDEMARLQAILSGKAPKSPNPVQESQQQNEPVELLGPGQISQKDVAAMHNILTKLNSVSNKVVTELVMETHQDAELKSAIVTEKTDSGIKIGKYEIKVKDVPGSLSGKQQYDVVNTKANETIAEDLTLYESAQALVKLLNKGNYINSPIVIRLLQLEATYCSRRIDAARLKKLIETTKDKTKKQLYENKFDAAKTLAIQAKTSIKKISSGEYIKSI